MIEKFLDTIEKKHVLVAGELSSRTPPEKVYNANLDLLVLYHTTELGIPRIGGMLPIENSNDLVLTMCEKLPIHNYSVPVFAGICGIEPVRYFPLFFRNLAATGVSGVQNFPTVGLIDGQYRYNLESVNLGVKCEEEALKIAITNGLGILPFAFNQYETLAMAKAGAKIVILDLGFCPLTYDIREEIRQYLERLRSIGTLVHSLYPDVKILVYTMYHEIEQQLEALLPQLAYIDGIYRSVLL